MNERVAFWLGAAAVVALAALLLWLRDRVRDLRHVPESERKLSERRNAKGATAFVCLIWAAASAFGAVKSGTIAARLPCILVAAISSLICWQAFLEYRKIGSESTRRELDRKTG